MNHDDLIHRFLDGTASQAEAAELSQLIETDANVRNRYLDLAELHAVLSADESLREKKSRPAVNWTQRVTWLKMAAALALLASGAWWLASPAKVMPPMAKLISSLNAQWADENTELTLNAGEAPTGLLRLLDGKVEFSTAHGAVVVLEGKTVMRFENATTIFIESGRVVCRCPTPESRVTVHTPQTQVVDLGTEFAVEARADSSTRVAVLSGEVRVGGEADARVLHQGEAAEVRSEGVTMLHTEVVREMMPLPVKAEAALHTSENLLKNPDFSSAQVWSAMERHVLIKDGTVRISSHGHRYWPFTQQSLWQNDLPGRIVTASVRAKQDQRDPLQPLQFAVLKVIFKGKNGRHLAYASRHFQFGGETPDLFQKATITAVAPPETRGLSVELLLNARGEERGTVVFDDALLTVSQPSTSPNP